MESDVDPNDPTTPQLFYHLGDVAYFYGQDNEYYSQFYEPYDYYPDPIFAIPGNHDEMLPLVMTLLHLTVSRQIFVQKKFDVLPDAGDSNRQTMIQPNPHWTLNIPYAIIIGLYSNVPEGGWFGDDQITWLQKELTEAPPPQDKALIIAVHHPAYSADQHHSGSKLIQQTLDNAIKATKRYPDIVVAGHVYNYQRFTRELDDDHHGYMILTVASGKISGEYYIVPKPTENWGSHHKEPTGLRWIPQNMFLQQISTDHNIHSKNNFLLTLIGNKRK